MVDDKHYVLQNLATQLFLQNLEKMNFRMWKGNKERRLINQHRWKLVWNPYRGYKEKWKIGQMKIAMGESGKPLFIGEGIPKNLQKVSKCYGTVEAFITTVTFNQ